MFAVLSIAPASAGTIPYPNAGTINPATYSFTATSTGTLTPYFYGSNAKDYEVLNVYDIVSGASLTNEFLNQATPTGASVPMTVTAGDSLVFTVTDQTSGLTLSSIPGNNADGDQHVYATAFPGGAVNVNTDFGQGSATLPAGLYIGFEDTPYPYGDFNYADLQFVVTDTTVQTPEPASWLILGTASAVMAAGRRRRRAG